MKSFGIAVTILLVGLLGCAAEDTQKAETDLSAFAVTSSVEGTDLGKFDAVSTISTWNVRESEHHTLLEGLNAAGNRKFGAIMETAPDSAVTNVQIIGETSCEAQLNLATLELVETTCTAAQINALEIPAIQLVDTFTPLLTDDAGKSDGYFTRAACVGAGIGAAVLTAMVWQFAAGAATVGGSVATVPGFLAAGGSILGAVALCYDAFVAETPFSECVSDCSPEFQCMRGCVEDVLDGQEPAESASNYLLCLGNCEGDDCDRVCVGFFDRD